MIIKDVRQVFHLSHRKRSIDRTTSYGSYQSFLQHLWKFRLRGEIMSQRRKSNKFFQYAVTSYLVLVPLLITTVICAAQTPQCTLRLRQRVGMLDTVYTAVAYYVPARPQRILVLAHGYPWPDETASDETLTEYARADVQRWAAFAEVNNVILLLPRSVVATSSTTGKC
jgi:hypothetical protein